MTHSSTKSTTSRRDDGADELLWEQTELQWMRAEIQQWLDGGKPHGAIPRIQELERRISVIEKSKDKLNFDNNGRVSVDVDSLLKSPKVQAQVEAVRKLADASKPNAAPPWALEGLPTDPPPPVQSTDSITTLLMACRSYFAEHEGYYTGLLKDRIDWIIDAPLQLPPLTDVMYHAVRGSEYDFTDGGPHTVTGYLNDDCLDEIWDNINTALRCQGNKP